MTIAKVDYNQCDITLALRKLGASVCLIHTVGNGCPDMVVGYRGENFLLELKDGSKPKNKQRLTRDEERWHEKWKGQVAVVKDIYEAIKVINKRSE